MNKVLFSLLFLISSIGAYSQDTIAVNNQIFETVEVEAEFPGGVEAWRNFLMKNLNPNVPVKNGAPLGKYTVYVQFIVAKDGTVRDVVPLTKLGFGMENEVVQLLKKSGKWSPAIQNDRPVNAYRKQPVTFMVTGDDIRIATETPYVLYTGRDNEIMLDIKRVKNEDLTLTITKGTITKGSNGSYIAKVKGTGRALLTITRKKGKEVATVSFEIMDK